MGRFFFNIDVLGMGQCNLRCPSCPVGNEKHVKNPMGMMRAPLLDQILRKAASEVVIEGVGLFNWAEPLIHPDLPELVRVVKSYGVRCDLSSNLNFMPRIDEVLAENADSFRISCSGFNQSNYGVTHRGGDVEVVKTNMRLLAEAKARTNSKTQIHMLYHRYKHNLSDEPQMRAYCTELGFSFEPVWAMFMPLEKILAYVQDDESLAHITDEDRAVIASLALPLREAMEASKAVRAQPCILQTRQMTLDYKGDVMLCCGVYDAKTYKLGSFLDTPIAEFQEMKYQSSMCDRCMKAGAHVYATYGAPKLDMLVGNTVLLELAQQVGYAQAIKKAGV